MDMGIELKKIYSISLFLNIILKGPYSNLLRDHRLSLQMEKRRAKFLGRSTKFLRVQKFI